MKKNKNQSDPKPGIVEYVIVIILVLLIYFGIMSQLATTVCCTSQQSTATAIESATLTAEIDEP